MSRPPTDRVSALTRLGLAAGCGAAACLPWVDQTPNVYDRLWSVAAIVSGVLLLASVVFARRLPALVVDPAATLASVVFFAEVAESAIEHEQRAAGNVRTMLFAGGLGVIALAVMYRSMADSYARRQADRR